MNFSFILRLAALWLICQSLVANPLKDHSREFTDGSGQRLTIDLPHGSPKTQGFHPAKITAINTSSKPVTWEVTITESGFWNDRYQSNNVFRTQIEVPSQQSIEREVLFPAGEENRNSISIQVHNPTGQQDDWSLHQHYDSNKTNSGVEKPVLVGVHAAQLLNNLPVDDSDIHSLLNPASASADWRAYTPFILVVLGPEDWQALSLAARAALGDWTRMGGNLQFLGDLPTDAPVADLLGLATRSLGGVFSSAAGSDGKMPDFSDLLAVKAAMPTASPAYEASVNGISIVQAWLEKTHEHLIQERFTVWPMILVLLAFFVMITPINLFVLAPSRRRYRLFYTIPIISISACALLALAVLVGDGIGGEGRRLVWIESRPGTENRQFISQWQASRSGALFGTSFTTKDAAFISPLSEPGGAMNLRVGADHVEGSGAWFISRATQSQFLQTARPGRGRIEWTMRDSKAPEAVSTFEFALRDVYVCDEDGAWWHAPTLKQGETTVFQLTNQKAVDDVFVASFKGAHLENWMSKMQERKGHFIALTDQPPAIETLKSIRWKDQGVVSGALHTP